MVIIAPDAWGGILLEPASRTSGVVRKRVPRLRVRSQGLWAEWARGPAGYRHGLDVVQIHGLHAVQIVRIGIGNGAHGG